MMLPEKIRAWSYARQHLGHNGRAPLAVLTDVLGVYSNHPTAPLALWARLQSFNAADFFALEKQRLVARLPAMRESVYLLPAKTALAIKSAVLPPAGDPYWQKRYSQKGRFIPPEMYENWANKILAATGKPATAAFIKTATAIPEESLKPMLNRLAFEGRLLRLGAASLRSNIISYVAMDGWLEQPPAPVDADAALVQLAHDYWRAFGPARLQDFQWWAGVSVTKARQALATLHTTQLEEHLFLLTADLADFEACRPLATDAVDILPQWDSYTMGYAPDGRDRFVSHDMKHHVYGAIGATRGNALGVVLVNGAAHGIWSPQFNGARLTITIKMLEKPGDLLNSKIVRAFENMAVFLQARQLQFENWEI